MAKKKLYSRARSSLIRHLATHLYEGARTPERRREVRRVIRDAFESTRDWYGVLREDEEFHQDDPQLLLGWLAAVWDELDSE